MEYVRQIVDSELLDKLQLPRHLRNRKVEVIVLPTEEHVKSKKNRLIT
ncbi:MAG: hypothetical protein FWF08_00505 [Oscillospiraceae bacterium]|nr:hypothetical protein [Oscillospiraceae bacterium]